MNDDANFGYKTKPINSEDSIEAITPDERDEFSEREYLCDSDLVSDDSLLVATNLSKLPVSEWHRIQVSSRSYFMDLFWDFQDEVAYQGCFRYSFDKKLPDGSLLTDQKNEQLALFFRALIHYYLPHNDLISRNRLSSYTSTVKAASNCYHIACWLICNGLFESRQNSKIRTAPSISQVEIDQFVRKLPEGFSFGQAKSIIAMLENWYDLSRAGMLPVEFSLLVSAKKGRSIFDILPDYEQSMGWQPIAADVLYPLVTGSLRFMEERAEDIVSVVEAWAIGRERGSDAKSRSYCQSLEVKKWTQKKEVDLLFKDKDGRRWLDVPQEDHYGNFRVAWVYEIARALSAACWVLIIFPMGFRRSEVCELEVGCTRLANEQMDEYRIKATIFKTSEGSSGDPVELPCPAVTHLAVKTLERLTSFTRAPGETKLFTNLRHGRQRYVGNIIDDLDLLCTFLEIPDVPHSHQFRKTIASFFVYQNPQNIYLLKRLFSHASLRMTMKYITSIKTISREIKEYISINNRELLGDLFQSALDGCLGGRGGNKISRIVREGFKGLSEEDVMESAETYVEALLDSGVAMLHRTPLCICTKTPSLTQKAPCDPVIPSVQSQLHPRIEMCTPWDCNFAAFTPADEASVRVDIDFHVRLLQRQSLSESQRKISKRIINRGNEILSELRPERLTLSGAS
ncbi:tyrosine-type recombinase/integrase [Zhongshania guokunii]|uniref:Tyrosine-type recombinase/integrase n=1 Tax=Zhongshania guokunii TaxID=641783 RepID=A0ABV3U5W1_9GAMM